MTSGNWWEWRYLALVLADTSSAAGEADLSAAGEADLSAAGEADLSAAGEADLSAASSPAAAADLLFVSDSVIVDVSTCLSSVIVVRESSSLFPASVNAVFSTSLPSLEKKKRKRSLSLLFCDFFIYR